MPNPGSNTYAALKTLSDHIALENSNKHDTKILFFITGKKQKSSGNSKKSSNLDGDLGVEIEPNCLNNPTNPLLPDEASCGQMYKELLYSLENINSIQGLGKSPLTSDPFSQVMGNVWKKLFDKIYFRRLISSFLEFAQGHSRRHR